MTNYMNQTTNPLVILACLLCLALAALARTTVNIVTALAVALYTHRRLLALLALPIVAVIAANLAWPLIVAVAGKVIVGGGATAAFGFVFRP